MFEAKLSQEPCTLETWEWCQNAQNGRFPIPLLETDTAYLHQKESYLIKTKFMHY